MGMNRLKAGRRRMRGRETKEESSREQKEELFNIFILYFMRIIVILGRHIATVMCNSSSAFLVSLFRPF
jgi:hypothetical protein